MSKPSFGQALHALNLIKAKDPTSEQLAALYESGILSDILDVDLWNIDRDAVRAALKKFIRWRSFLIGGVNKNTLLARIDVGFSIEYWARNLMAQRPFTTHRPEKRIETIMLSPAGLGYKRIPSIRELLHPGCLAQWNMRNAHRLPDGYSIELLPAEAGPHIREQYKDQPKGEVLWIAMKRIIDSEGDPRVFVLENKGSMLGELSAHNTDIKDALDSSSRIVFHLRKV